MSIDISCKKIIKNDNDIIVFDDNDLEHVIFGIFFTLAGLFALAGLYVLLEATPSEKIEDWLAFIFGFSIFVIFGIGSALGQLEKITIDRRIQSVYIEGRRLFFIKGKERTIKFSEILYPSIKENNTTDPPPSWDIILNLTSGENKHIFRGENHKEAKAFFDKICAFLKGDEVSNFIFTSKGSTPDYSSHHRNFLNSNNIFYNLILAFSILISVWGIFQLISLFSINGEEIFVNIVPNESTFYVELATDKSYVLKLAEFSGNPQKIIISIRKGSYVALDETFNRWNGDGYVILFRKKFNVKEDGTYQVNVKILNSGSFKLGIERYNSSWI